jgi:hypothetical protein
MQPDVPASIALLDLERAGRDDLVAAAPPGAAPGPPSS